MQFIASRIQFTPLCAAQSHSHQQNSSAKEYSAMKVITLGCSVCNVLCISAVHFNAMESCLVQCNVRQSSAVQLNTVMCQGHFCNVLHIVVSRNIVLTYFQKQIIKAFKKKNNNLYILFYIFFFFAPTFKIVC